MIEHDTDPADAVALLERLIPEGEPPSAVTLDPGSLPGFTVWNVRMRKAAYRMKVATTAKWGLRLRAGAAVATAAGRAGVPVPELVRLEEDESDPPFTIALETRVGSTNAGSAWARLTRPERNALADAAATTLARLHAVPAEPRLLHRAPPTPERWRSGVEVAVTRSLERLRADDVLPKNLVASVSDRLRRHLERFPPAVPIVLSHGRFRLSSLALEKRALAALVDFEHARAVDPLVDVVHLAVSTGHGDGTFSQRFRAGYLAANPVASEAGGVDDRAALYAGLDILQALRGPGADSVEAQSWLIDLLEAWLEGFSWGAAA